MKEEIYFKTCNQDLTKVFNEHYRNKKKGCKRLLKDDSYVDEMKGARKEYKRKKSDEACFGVEKEMVVRYMTVITQ